MKFEEKIGDLFNKSSSKSALAHCISEDVAMGKGIAVMFLKLYGGVDDIKKQVVDGKKTGKAAILERDERLVFYLITKKFYYQKPTYESLESSLTDLRDQLNTKGVYQLSIPRIGCGLDGLHWDKVKEMIKRVFEKTDIHIQAFTLRP